MIEEIHAGSDLPVRFAQDPHPVPTPGVEIVGVTVGEAREVWSIEGVWSSVEVVPPGLLTRAYRFCVRRRL